MWRCCPDSKAALDKAAGALVAADPDNPSFVEQSDVEEDTDIPRACDLIDLPAHYMRHISFKRATKTKSARYCVQWVVGKGKERQTKTKTRFSPGAAPITGPGFP